MLTILSFLLIKTMPTITEPPIKNLIHDKYLHKNLV